MMVLQYQAKLVGHCPNIVDFRVQVPLIFPYCLRSVAKLQSLTSKWFSSAAQIKFKQFDHNNYYCYKQAGIKHEKIMKEKGI